MSRMAVKRNHYFLTDRLAVNEWHSFGVDDWPEQNLADFICETMTERVTQSLPPAWQGTFTKSRALEWISQRDGEGITLLVLDKNNKHAIGLVVLFEPEQSNLRLGYLLKESAWGKGFASELIGGFVEWCQHHEIHSITGGVEQDNVASRRVLEKCGFKAEPKTRRSEEQLFTLVLR